VTRKSYFPKYTPEKRARLEYEADLIARRTRYKALAVELGMSEDHIAHLIGEMVQQKKRELLREQDPVLHRESKTNIIAG